MGKGNEMGLRDDDRRRRTVRGGGGRRLRLFVMDLSLHLQPFFSFDLWRGSFVVTPLLPITSID